MDQNDASISDESFDRYARLIRASLGVPSALIPSSMANRQISPGASGLPQPWQDARKTFTDGPIQARDRDIDQNVERLLECASVHRLSCRALVALSDHLC